METRILLRRDFVRVASRPSALMQPPSGRPTLHAVSIFFRSLCLMLRCGVPLHQALTCLGKGGSDPLVASASTWVAHQIECGSSLSRAMASCPNVFGHFPCKMIQVAEKTGKLDDVLLALALYEEKTSRLVLRLKVALHYPMVLCAGGLLLLLLTPPLLFRNLLPLLRNGSLELPWLTRAFMGLSELLSNPLVVIPLLLLVGWAIRRALRLLSSPRWRQRLLRLPYLGPLLKTVAVSRFARALAMELEVGLDPLLALAMAAECTQDPWLQDRIGVCQAALRQGAGLALSLERIGYFPRAFVLVIRTAEETGDVPDMCRRLAELYDDNLEMCAQTFAALLEPLMLVVMGGAAGLMVMAMMGPLLRVVETLL